MAFTKEETAFFSKIIPPQSETNCTTYCSGGKPIYLITKSLFQGTYFLYSIDGQALTRIAKGASPTELETKHHLVDQMIPSFKRR